MKNLCLLGALLFSPITFATGLSMLEAQLTPLALTHEGALLYKFKRSENSLGAHRLMPVSYGLGVFNDGQFIELEQTLLTADETFDKNAAFYLARDQQLNHWFEKECTSHDLFEQFTQCNLAAYKVDKWLNPSQVQQQYGVDLYKATHYALIKGEFTADQDSQIFVQYNLPNYLVVQFKAECISAAKFAEMQVINPALSTDLQQSIPYECTKITSIIKK